MQSGRRVYLFRSERLAAFVYHCTCQLVLDESIFAYLSAKVNVKKTDKEIKEKFSLSAYFIGASLFRLCDQTCNPYPQWGGDHEHKDAEGQRGGTRAYILLIAAADDDAREGGRKGASKHHHL